jgi:hypothetical protein
MPASRHLRTNYPWYTPRVYRSQLGSSPSIEVVPVRDMSVSRFGTLNRFASSEFVHLSQNSSSCTVGAETFPSASAPFQHTAISHLSGCFGEVTPTIHFTVWRAAGSRLAASTCPPGWLHGCTLLLPPAAGRACPRLAEGPCGRVPAAGVVEGGRGPLLEPLPWAFGESPRVPGPPPAPVLSASPPCFSYSTPASLTYFGDGLLHEGRCAYMFKSSKSG